jgi:hypothetical protein
VVLHSPIVSLGFVDAKFNTSLFIFWCRSDIVYILLYVNGIVLTTSNPMLLQHTISSLKWEFAMEDLKPNHHFLGVSVQ